MNQADLPEYVAISIEAVGGIDTDEGQEMLRLLMTKEDKPLPSYEKAAPVEIIEAQKQLPSSEQNIMGEELEGMFSKILSMKP